MNLNHSQEIKKSIVLLKPFLFHYSFSISIPWFTMSGICYFENNHIGYLEFVFYENMQ